MFTFVYEQWFYGDGTFDGQKLKEYFLFVAISCTVCNFLAILSIAAIDVYVQQANDRSIGQCSIMSEFFKMRRRQSVEQRQPILSASSSVREYSNMGSTDCTENMPIDLPSKQIGDEETFRHQQKGIYSLSLTTLTGPIQRVVESETENPNFVTPPSEPTARCC